MSKKTQGELILLLTAILYGASFSAQRIGMQHMGPFAWNTLRFFIGALVLLPVVYFTGRPARIKSGSDSSAGDGYPAADTHQDKKTLIKGGAACGIALFAAATLQQVGIVYTTAAKSGFITALYMVMVPILAVFIGKKARPLIWLCIVIAAAGLYLLTMKNGFVMKTGDFLTLLCALGYAVHLLIIDHFSPRVDGVRMSCIQFFVCGILSIPFTVFAEHGIDLAAVSQCVLPLLYNGVITCGVAFTLQIIGQQKTEPAVASLILCLESVFSAVFGALLLHEMLSGRELLGCGIMFTAILLAQLPEKRGRRQQ